MNKEQKMVYLFNKRWDKPKGHNWILTGKDVMKYQVQYECTNCGDFQQLDIYNPNDTRGHIQLLNHLIPKCR